MPKITFIKPDGTTHPITVKQGTTIMEAGRDNNIGIEGTCGGSLSCATCHVIFSDKDFERVGPPSDDELDMLDLAFGVQTTSRLGCQITLSEGLDDLTVKIPDEM